MIAQDVSVKPMTAMPEEPREPLPGSGNSVPWVRNVSYLWMKRVVLVRAVGVSFLLSIVVSLTLPKQYESSTRVVPPQQTSGGAAMLAALAGKAGAAGGGLAGLAGGLLGGRGNGALFISLLRSGTVSGHLIDRFQLQHVYRKRYLLDTAKKLARKTTIAEDTKSGVITIVVEDTDRQRARDMAVAYVEELNALVAQVNNSSAHLERMFIEQRLETVRRELQKAQVDLSQFSTTNTAIDIKEQTRALVDSGARLQGQLIAGQGELESLEQIYGPENVRVHAAEARLGNLRHELGRVSGGQASSSGIDETHPYPALRQLPALAVEWANLYRAVRIQETVFEMLSAQYEMARIEEAKSVASVSVVDAPGIAEKKSSPHRTLIVVLSTAVAFVTVTLLLLAEREWRALEVDDPRRALWTQICSELAACLAGVFGRAR